MEENEKGDNAQNLMWFGLFDLHPRPLQGVPKFSLSTKVKKTGLDIESVKIGVQWFRGPTGSTGVSTRI